MKSINGFLGPYTFLSNFYPAQVALDGIIYPTVEHAYQASKTNVPSERAHVLASADARIAKRRGRHVTMSDGWERTKVGLMLILLQRKFQDSDLKAKLLATGDADLVEGNNWHDNFWGDCRCKVRPLCKAPGENWLGRLLMQVRAGLR